MEPAREERTAVADASSRSTPPSLVRYLASARGDMEGAALFDRHQFASRDGAANRALTQAERDRGVTSGDDLVLCIRVLVSRATS